MKVPGFLSDPHAKLENGVGWGTDMGAELLNIVQHGYGGNPFKLESSFQSDRCVMNPGDGLLVFAAQFIGSCLWSIRARRSKRQCDLPIYIPAGSVIRVIQMRKGLWG